MTDADRDAVASEATVRYRLTPAVSRLLRALLDGVPRRYLSVELGVGENTIKTHAGKLLRATKAGSVDELVWLLRGWPAR